MLENPLYSLLSPFYFRNKVVIDGHKEIIGTVTGILFKDNDSCEIQVSWWNNGDVKADWFAKSRLTLVPE